MTPSVPDEAVKALADWLLEQVAVDEADALRICPGRSADNGHWVRGSIQDDAVRMTDPRHADHVLRYDPARVLAECEATRGIIGLAAEQPSVFDEALRWLALPYADRAGYRDEWRP